MAPAALQYQRNSLLNVQTNDANGADDLKSKDIQNNLAPGNYTSTAVRNKTN